MFASKMLSVLFSMMLALTVSCTDDQKKPEEAVQVASDTGSDSASASAFMPEVVYFAFDDYTLSMDAQSKLNALADHLKNNAGVSVQIEGHCDERGTTEYNLALGQRRAESVKNYLVRLGVSANSLSTISYGEERPRTEGSDESSWSQNRRAEFVLSR